MTASGSSSKFYLLTILHGLTPRNTLISTDRHEKLKSPKRLSYIIKRETWFIVIQWRNSAITFVLMISPKKNYGNDNWFICLADTACPSHTKNMALLDKK